MDVGYLVRRATKDHDVSMSHNKMGLEHVPITCGRNYACFHLEAKNTKLHGAV